MHRNETWPTPAIVWGMKVGAVVGALQGFWIGGFSDVIHGGARFSSTKKLMFIFTLLGAFNGANAGGACGYAYDSTVKYSIQVKKDAIAMSAPIIQKLTNMPCDGLRFFKQANSSNTPAPQPEKTTVNKV